MASPKVAVVGAGPAGCMLARLLHQGGVAVVVFERADASHSGGQGGSLDLHTDDGLAAVKEAGLYDEFKKHARYDGQALSVVDKQLNTYMKLGSGSKSRVAGDRPEIDRAALQDIFCQSLPKEMIRWGHAVENVQGGCLFFKDGSSAAGFDLIVGADGAFSKVRGSIAPDLKPIYTGVSYRNLSVANAEETAPGLHALVNRGMVLASADGVRWSLQQLGDGSINININISVARHGEDSASADSPGHGPYDLEEAKKALLQEFRDWDTIFLDAIRLSDRVQPRSLYILPVGSRWEHRPGVTLIGDAAHLMTPFAGEGVNQALRDASLLSRAILKAVEAKADVDESIQRMEDNMMARVRGIQQLSYDLLQDWMFTTGAPKKVLPKAIARHVNKELPSSMSLVGTLGTHAYFFFRNM